MSNTAAAISNKATNTNNTPQEIWQTIKNSKNPLICMDTRFDYDALCSVKVFKDAIKKHLNKEATIIFSGEIDESVSQNVDFSDIKTKTDIKDVDLSVHDALIFLDSGSVGHVSLDINYKLPQQKIKINIDHHSTNPYFGDLNYVLPLASACSVLYTFFQELEIELSKQSYSHLLLGIVLDSGFFQFNTVTPKDLRIVAEIMEKGIELFPIMWKLNFNDNYDTLKMRALVYSNLNVNFDKKFAYSTVSQKELLEKNVDEKKVTQARSDMIKRLAGVDFVFVVSEKVDETPVFSVSFRAHNIDIDVTKFAKLFGGGGHMHAAGGMVEGVVTMKDALSVVFERLQI